MQYFNLNQRYELNSDDLSGLVFASLISPLVLSAEETLDGDEKPTCSKCKARTKCEKWYMVERWPKILVIHLKRFSPGGGFRNSKLSNHVDVPTSDLNLRYCPPPSAFECFFFLQKLWANN